MNIETLEFTQDVRPGETVEFSRGGLTVRGQVTRVGRNSVDVVGAEGDGKLIVARRNILGVVSVKTFAPAPAAGVQRILRLPAVLALCGLSESVIYKRIRQGVFPPQVKLGGGIIGWVESEVLAIHQAERRGASKVERRELVDTLKAERLRGPELMDFLRLADGKVLMRRRSSGEARYFAVDPGTGAFTVPVDPDFINSGDVVAWETVEL